MGFQAIEHLLALVASRNVGPDINTEFEEQYPSVSADGETLIFGSNREPGRKNDLYMSWRLRDPHPFP